MNLSTTNVSRHGNQDTSAIGRKISGMNCFSLKFNGLNSGNMKKV